MKNTWLVSHSTHMQIFFDLISYFNYLFKLNFLYLSFNNLFFGGFKNSQIYSFYYLTHEIDRKIIYNSQQSKTNNKFLRLKTKNIFKKKRKTPSILFTSKKFTFQVKSKFFMGNTTIFFFNAFFLMNQIPLNHQQFLHHNFYLFGASKTRIKFATIEPKKFFKKWQDIYSLLLNFCYFNHLPLIYSSSFFKQETLSLNWHFNRFNMTMWRNIYPLFLTKTTVHSHKVNFIFEKLRKLRLSFALITDCEHHFKLLYYFNSYKWYTVGLITNNVDPWLVSFAMPIFQNNFFMQFFFIKFFILICKISSFQKFVFKRNLWFYHQQRYLYQPILKI